MKLHELNIANFRCFETYHIQFKSGINILYGLNGAGKTTLIHAVCKALSFIMATDTVQTSGAASRKEIHSVANGNTRLKVEGYSSNGDFYLSEQDDHDGKTTQPDITIEAIGDLDGRSLHWAITALSRNPRLRKSEYIEAFRSFWDWHQSTGQLPVLAYYSDGFPHVEDRSSVSEKVASLRNFGYYDWNNEEACSVIWIERMERSLKERERMERRRNRGEAYDERKLDMLRQEISMIEQCFKTFSDGDSYIEAEAFELSTFNDQLCIRSVGGRLFSFRQLPAGYKRLFCILLDIAYRSYILNGSVDATGIVIIDEIDLHLHPALERVVLSRFQKVFPRLQFIISTHSPLVITSMKTDAERNCIYRMEPDTTTPHIVGDVYGLDYNSGIEDVMQVSSADEKLSRLVSTYVYMVRNDLKPQADNLKANILRECFVSQTRLDDMINQLLTD